MFAGTAVILLCGAVPSPGQDGGRRQISLDQYLIEHPECTFFGPQRDQFLAAQKQNFRLSKLTNQVVGGLSASVSRADRAAAASNQAASTNLIDKYLFAAMKDANVAPADKTNDFEFIRRVTLDLTGRIPTALLVQAFVADISPDKRAKLVDTLLNSSEWVDKWTMYFGDLFKNTANKVSSGAQAQNEGRNAFYKWIKDALANNKPYDQIARDVISAQASNSWDPKQGAANWTILGRVTGGPLQDTQDQVTANVAETFLGLANLNCLLCHNGRGHLDSLNLWGKNTTRYQAWQMAAFEAHTPVGSITRPNPANQNSYYWTLADNLKTDYVLGSTSGNRPSRTGFSNSTVPPVYLFSGNTPKNGENYRAAFGREVTSDIQFSRAAVNYLWKEFFGRGIVEPANQFDPARLDPDNPPTDPWPQDPSQSWPLQPSNAAMLNALAQNFATGGFDLKALMRLIANSDAYQLSARYNGDWNPQWEPLFARKLVRRLWAEEIHDSIAISSGVQPAYKVYLGQDPTDVPGGTVTLNWAMQLPETNSRFLGGVTANVFMDAFLRGNRDDIPRREEGSLSQALNLMNDPYVMNRVRTATAGPNSLINRSLTGTDDQLVNNLFISVLSRYPNDQEKSLALNSLKTGDRKQKAENLLWSLYNKVDFIFNY
ncbi:MAG: DUF1549 and DUF1553 domain-containing protein [Acidobacteriota bacterium]|nr:DUF1549 and DUF1553 domain-containing protein [Acidobacteriota bacterium]